MGCTKMGGKLKLLYRETEGGFTILAPRVRRRYFWVIFWLFWGVFSPEGKNLSKPYFFTIFIIFLLPRPVPGLLHHNVRMCPIACCLVAVLVKLTLPSVCAHKTYCSLFLFSLLLLNFPNDLLFAVFSYSYGVSECVNVFPCVSFFLNVSGFFWIF